MVLKIVKFGVGTMVEVRIYGRAPNDYSSQGTDYGSNLKIYQDILNEIKHEEEKIEEVHIALYLFNNLHLLNELLKLKNRGAEVVIISLPLTGYDSRKIKAAREVYSAVLRSGLRLLVFPHMYVWYGAEYAGGGASYSFHVKSGIIKYKDGSAKAFLTSGNLAPGDPTHSETALFVKDKNPRSLYIRPFELFFKEIEQRSKRYENYKNQVDGLDESLQQVFDFAFIGGSNPINYTANEAQYAFFTAPFISMDGIGSNHYARLRIVRAIQSAKRRVLLCAQHVHDISPFNGFEGETVIKALIEAKTSNAGMDVRVLKQVSSAGLADKRRAAFVECHLEHAGVKQRENKLVHDKFVVADDTVIVSTSNFTATQFGWGERRMEFKTGINDLAIVEKVVAKANAFFENAPRSVECRLVKKRKGKPEVKVVKTDTFSEVNCFVELMDSKLADNLVEYFNSLWGHRLSSDVKIPV